MEFLLLFHLSLFVLLLNASTICFSQIQSSINSKTYIIRSSDLFLARTSGFVEAQDELVQPGTTNILNNESPGNDLAAT